MIDIQEVPFTKPSEERRYNLFDDEAENGYFRPTPQKGKTESIC